MGTCVTDLELDKNEAPSCRITSPPGHRATWANPCAKTRSSIIMVLRLGCDVGIEVTCPPRELVSNTHKRGK